MEASKSKSTSGEKAPVPTIKRSDDGSIVLYGFTHDGAFHSFAAEGSGDYDERVQAAKDNG